MSQTLLTSFFTVRKASSQEDKLKQNPSHGKVATVKKRKREDEEAENFSLFLSEDEEGVDNENGEHVEDWEGEQVSWPRVAVRVLWCLNRHVCQSSLGAGCQPRH